MEEILKENKSKSHKEFEKLLAEDLVNRKFKEGEITIGTVEEIGKKFVFIDLGLKSSGAIPVAEFNLTKSLDKITVGSKIEVLLEKIENKHGEVVVSHEKATRAKSWKKIEAKFFIIPTFYIHWSSGITWHNIVYPNSILSPLYS